MSDAERAAAEVDRVLAARPRRLRHVHGVHRRALVAAPIVGTDIEILGAVALLHDIGYAADLAVHGFHPLDGARYLSEHGWSERICALVARHSFALAEAELRGLAEPLARWPDEGGVVRDALWWADMTTSPDGATVSFDHRIDEIQQRYGPHDVVTSFIRLARPELRAAVERTEQRLRVAGIAYE